MGEEPAQLSLASSQGLVVCLQFWNPQSIIGSCAHASLLTIDGWEDAIVTCPGKRHVCLADLSLPGKVHVNAAGQEFPPTSGRQGLRRLGRRCRVGRHGQLEAEQDAALRDSIQRGEATGAPIISDGEQQRSSFATYPITDTLTGTGLAEGLSGEGGQYFAIFADGHGRQLPRLTKGPFRYKAYAADSLRKSVQQASKPMKQAVIAPSMLALLYPLHEEVPGYPREQFEKDLADECERDTRAAFDAGAARVSIDFTEGRLATRNDPRNPWTGADLLPRFVELNNMVLDRFTPEERRNIGVHTCPGGDRDSVHSADVPYNNLLPEMFKINAGYFLIQLASERDKDPVYRSIGQYLRSDANGVAQLAYVGVIDPLNPRVESVEEVRDALVRAANFIPREQLGSTDDCGFSPFSIDEKPSHGSPDFARDIAFQKIANRVEGTRAAAAELGVS